MNSTDEYTLPLTDVQLRFAIATEVNGRRVCVPLLFRLSPGAVSAAELAELLDRIANGNPALCCRVDLEADPPVQHWQAGGCDFTVRKAPSAAAASRCVAEAVNGFEESVDAPSMSARLIQVGDGGDDLLLLMFDHVSVDEQSLTIVKQQLGAPPRLDPNSDAPFSGAWRRYEAAVLDRVDAERKAAQAEASLAFWRERLEAAAGHLPGRVTTEFAAESVHTPNSVAIPCDMRGSIFPLVLASFHRALRDLKGPGPTAVGYTWGNRNSAFADVVGCFMNTAVSIDTTGDWATAGEGTARFRQGWWRELDHVDVPYSSVAEIGATLDPPWSGHFDSVLIFEHAPSAPQWTVADVPIVELAPEYAVPNAPIAAAVVVAGDELRLRIVAAGGTADEWISALGERWRHWLAESLSHNSMNGGS